MKKCTLLLTVFAAVMLNDIEANAQNNVIDEIVWVVGDEAIYKSEVEEARRDAQLNGTRWDGDPYCIIPEQLAINKLFMNQAELDSVIVSDDDVRNDVEEYYKQLVEGAGSEEKLMEYQSMNREQIKNRLFETRRQAMMIGEVRSKMMSKVKVTPADVRRYIKNMSDDDIPYVKTQVEVQILTLDPVIPQEEIDAVKAELRGYAERVQAGEVSFTTLARLYSDDPTAIKNSGDVGFFGRGEMVPEFSAVAFNMNDPNKLSKIVETEYGFHLIQFVERLGDRVHVRHILRKPTVPDESIDKCLARLDTIARDIRDGNHSFEFCVAAYSQDKETYKNNGLMTFRDNSGSLGTSKFELQDLPQDVSKVIDRMQVGEVSQPFIYRLGNGKITCAIVKLKNKIYGHKATMAEDFQILYDIVFEARCQETLEKWIREKQRTTYVKISEGWNDCEFKYPGWGKN